MLPMWMAKGAAPAAAMGGQKEKGPSPCSPPTPLYTLKSNDRFSHDKATAELDYRPRDLMQTLHDTVLWLRSVCGSKPRGSII